MTELQNIEERLNKVVYLVDSRYSGAVQQLVEDLRYLLNIVKETDEDIQRHGK